MIRSPHAIRLRRWVAAGIGFGIATALGLGCHSTEHEPDPSPSPRTALYSAAQARPNAAPTATRAGAAIDSASPVIPTGFTLQTGNEQAGQAPEQSNAPRSAPPIVEPTTPVQIGPPVSEETLDLEVALRLAGVSNPTINIAREQIREALANQLSARSILLPSINIGGNYHDHIGNLQTSFGSIRNLHSQSFYFGFGARTLAAESVAFPGVRIFAHLGDAVFEPLVARQIVSARRSDAQAVNNSILLDVSTAYLELMGAEGRLTILKQGAADLDEVVRLTRIYAKTGQGRQADARRAESNADLLLNEIRGAQEEVAVASARLCRLLSLDPSLRVRTPGGSVEPFTLIPDDRDAESLIAIAVRARPEIFMRSAQITEAQYRVRQERVRPLLPLLSVGYSGGLFGGGSNLVATNFGPMSGRTDFDVFAVWTMQNLGVGNRARVRTADAVVGEALAAYQGTVNQVSSEVSEALAAAKAASRQLEIARNAVAIAEQGFPLEMTRIRGGFGRPIEVLDSFRQLVESRQEYLRAVIGFDIAQFRLFVAVGSNPLESNPSQRTPLVPAAEPGPAIPPAKQ
jgi:outer membrane protein TolC